MALLQQMPSQVTIVMSYMCFLCLEKKKTILFLKCNIKGMLLSISAFKYLRVVYFTKSVVLS